jgi:hypothetical protein
MLYTGLYFGMPTLCYSLIILYNNVKRLQRRSDPMSSAVSLVLIQFVYRGCRTTTDSESDKPGSKPRFFELLAPQIAGPDRTCQLVCVLCT